MAEHVYHLYVIRTSERQSLIDYLRNKNISTGIHYPTPLPFLKAYDYLNHAKEDFPIVSKQQNEILSIPMYPELSNQEMEYVAESIKKFFKK